LAIGVSTTLLLSTWSIASDKLKEIAIIVDKSGSNRLLTDKRFNQAAANYIDGELDNLKTKDKVILQSFGSLGTADNFINRPLTVKRHGQTSAKRKIKQAILNLPSTVKPQGSTNIIAWFSRNQPDCSEGNRLIFLTDGLEASEYIPNTNAWLEGKASLPKPHEFIQLKGCDITFYGLGVGLTDKQLTILRRQWRDYFAAAGATFRAIAL
jgi:hypothetical protein